MCSALGFEEIGDILLHPSVHLNPAFFPSFVVFPILLEVHATKDLFVFLLLLRVYTGETFHALYVSFVPPPEASFDGDIGVPTKPSLLFSFVVPPRHVVVVHIPRRPPPVPFSFVRYMYVVFYRKRDERDMHHLML